LKKNKKSSLNDVPFPLNKSSHVISPVPNGRGLTPNPQMNNQP